MNAAQLIEKLQQLDPKAEVVVQATNTEYSINYDERFHKLYDVVDGVEVEEQFGDQAAAYGTGIVTAEYHNEEDDPTPAIVMLDNQVVLLLEGTFTTYDFERDDE